MIFSDSDKAMTVLHEHDAESTESIGDRSDAGALDPTLLDCPRGVSVIIAGVDLDERHRFRLCEIGLAPGAMLRVTQKGMFGGRVIAFGSERIALDRDTARAIHVRPMQDLANRAEAPFENDEATDRKACNQ